MRTISFYYIEEYTESLDRFLDDPFFSESRSSMLIQIFSSLVEKDLVVNLIDAIMAKIPDATIIGASTSGEIYEGKMVDDGALICATLFENTILRTYQTVVDDPYEAGVKLAEALIGPKTKCIIAFADGLMINGEKILDGFNRANSAHIPIAGGMSADGGRFIETYAFCANQVQNNCVVAVALESEVLSVSQEYNLSWRAIGREMRVTDSAGNCVKEIDNRPIMEIYSEFLGEEVVANIPASTIEFPLIIKDDGIDVARSMIGKLPDDSILFAGEIPQGSVVRFGVGSVQLIDKTRSQNLVELSHTPCESIFIYSCTARKSFLGKGLEAEFIPLTKIAPVNGFFTYGEFFPSLHQSKLLNITTTILSLSEHTSALNTDVQSVPDNSQRGLTTDALLHLVDRVVSDLESYEKENIKIRCSLEELQASINQVLIISRTDPKGIIKEVNPLFCKISGYSESELVGSPHNIVRHPETPKETFEEMWSTIQSGKIWSGELRNRAKNGQSYYVKSFVIPIRDENANVIEYLAIREDITAMVETQQSLDKEQAFLNAVMDSQDNIVMISADNVIKKLNRKFFELFPFSDLDEFTSKYHCICNLFIKKEGYLGKVAGDGLWYEDVILYPHRIHKSIMADRWGRERIFLVKMRELYFQEALYQIVTFNDITQIEQAKIAADEARNSRSDFLAAMSHEIRTPMNGIIGFIDLIKTTHLDSKQQKYIDIISSSSKTLLSIINEILDFSKIESGKMEIENAAVSLVDEMDALYALFEANATSKSIRYHMKIDESVPSCILTDIVRLKQVLGNLIGNAIKFTLDGGEVRFEILHFEKADGAKKIRFLVHDTGIGIPKEKQSKIFEAFSQADTSTTREFGGTGLGLAISAKLVAMMGSTLQVESEVGKGSVFYFEIDSRICENGSVDKREIKTQENISDASQVRILVAEDYENNQILMGELLKRFGIVPDFVENGSMAIDRILENEYDIVLMDVNMPVMDGIEATKFIRRQSIDVPIVALTANAMEGDREKFISSGMNDYLSKPIVFEELQKIIERYSTGVDKIHQEADDKIKELNAIDYAQKELGLKRNIVEKLFAHFFANIDPEIEMIAQAIEKADHQQVIDIAHKIRGSAANLRLVQIAEIAKALETLPHEMMDSEGKEYLTKLNKLIQNAKSKTGF